MRHPRHILAVAFAVAFVVVLYSLLSPTGLSKNHELQHRVSDLKTNIGSLKAQVASLNQDIERLAGDSRGSLQYLEVIARDELHLIGQDETLILLDTARR